MLVDVIGNVMLRIEESVELVELMHKGEGTSHPYIDLNLPQMISTTANDAHRMMSTRQSGQALHRIPLLKGDLSLATATMRQQAVNTTVGSAN
jgi:hypothetical protein